MKNLSITLILTIAFLLTDVFKLSAQTDPTVTFDESRGNYIITYEGLDEELQSVIFEPRTKINPEISSGVNYDESSGAFKYDYYVFLEEESEQHLLAFTIQTKSSIIKDEKPDNEWKSNFSDRISGWRWINSFKNPRGLWVEELDISPGNGLNGFKISSTDPPAILNVYFEGNERMLSFPDEPPKKVMELFETLQNFEVNSVQRKTIGPQAPPDPFNHLDFLDSLKNYIPQAYELDWVEDQAFTNDLDSLLDEVRSYLSAGDSSAVTDPLETFIELVEQTNNGSGPPGAKLTSEGYALLDYNAAYLLERLPEPDPGSGIKREPNNSNEENGSC